jgi:lysophospholipase L1-like esterase
MSFLAMVEGRLPALFRYIFAAPSALQARTVPPHPVAVVANERMAVRAARYANATIPAQPHSEQARDLHSRQMMELPAIGDLDILLVGDSLAQHWPLGSWHPWTALNLGVGGDLTQHVLWRLDQIDWGCCRPRRILVVAGTNNLLFGEGHATVAAGIKAIAARLEAAHSAAELFVLMPPPLGIGLRRADEERRALKRLLAEQFGRRLIDVDTSMIADGLLPNPNYEQDLVHFTECGYAVLTDAVLAACELPSSLALAHDPARL